MGFHLREAPGGKPSARLTGGSSTTNLDDPGAFGQCRGHQPVRIPVKGREAIAYEWTATAVGDPRGCLGQVLVGST
jgi:hypothetical protein